MRAQISFEFIFTYGWAIFLVLVTIGSLVYFGVFDASSYVSDKCEISGDFICGDYYLAAPGDGSEVEIVITNALGKQMVLDHGAIMYQEQIGNSGCGYYKDTPGLQGGAGSAPWTLNPGDFVVMVCNPGSGASITFQEGDRAKVKFAFNYTIGSGLLKHYAEGVVIAKVRS